MDPEQLAEQLSDGDDSAGPLLVSVAGPILAGYAELVAADLGPVDRDEIVQKALETGVRRIGDFDPARGTFLAWARQLVRYQALMWRRVHAAGPDISLDQAPEPSWPSPDETSEATLRRAAAVNSLLPNLTSTDQTILRLRLEDRLTFPQIALLISDENDPTPIRLKRLEGASRKRFQRAVKKLRDLAASHPDLQDLT